MSGWVEEGAYHSTGNLRATFMEQRMRTATVMENIMPIRLRQEEWPYFWRR